MTRVQRTSDLDAGAAVRGSSGMHLQQPFALQEQHARAPVRQSCSKVQVLGQAGQPVHGNTCDKLVRGGGEAGFVTLGRGC